MNTLEPERLLEVSPKEFTTTIEDLERDGYRLLMIKPADAPREAVLQKPDRPAPRGHREADAGRERGLNIRLKVAYPSFGADTHHADPLALPDGQASASDGWTVGRAGMMYRDLIPDKLGGKLIASHIRLVDGGPVPDSVHYHKIDFQVIYCLKGAIKVVYEDQGPPFWLRPGDCVLQPPEIRHRVLEAEAGSEVIEITSPAEHETWFDQKMDLPTENIMPNRTYGRQRFVRHREDLARYVKTDNNDQEEARTEIDSAGTNLPELMTLRSTDRRSHLAEFHDSLRQISIMINGRGLTIKL